MSEKAMTKLEGEKISSCNAMDRKTSKPLMEKRRRQRINNSLTQIKTLVLQAMKKDPSRYSKLEKADILEMCVHHLRTVQKRQLSLTQNDASTLNKYREGFSKCATETMKYLQTGNNVNMDADVRNMLTGHLSNYASSMSTTPVSPSQNVTSTMEQPLNIRIPQVPSKIAQPINIQIPQSPVGTNTLYKMSQQTVSQPLLVAKNGSPNAVNCAYVVLGQANIVPMNSSGVSNTLVVSPTYGLTPNQSNTSPTMGALAPSPIAIQTVTSVPVQSNTPNVVKCETNNSSLQKSPMWRPW
ncbi:unnamed protein product [Owenia fusiformis]|uniref:Uncharacterized protein n=1 Tax=Owenia fusiformis TaxID=6347 RepID=A0A8S4MZV0_OWEFU|nr:unnamed protein product [Owenia fusiformis]